MDWGEGQGCWEREVMGELIEVLRFHYGEKKEFIV